jgi:hypothetical protein
MAFNVNAHVERLNRFLPFSPSHDQIYEEYQQTEDSLNLETRALAYARDAASTGANLIILTGDAGHGKTHLCRRLLEDLLGYEEDHARSLINEKCSGDVVIKHKDTTSSARGLRIFKDFSELPIAEASSRLEKLQGEQDAVTLICANEGKLRAVLEGADEGSFSYKVLSEFNSSFRDGLASRSGKIHIINLNFQSIAADGDERSLVIEALHQWTSGTRWRTCNECEARSGCPILANQKMLCSPPVGISEIRRDNLETILSTTERLGTIVTIREMLMLLAYLLTSGLNCKEVHRATQKGKGGWQHHHAYYNNLFVLPPNLTPDKLSRIPALLDISRLDPGLRASREIDEKIINEQGVFPENEIDLRFPSSTDRTASLIDAANGIDEIIGNPRNLKERQAEATFVQAVVQALRRRAYFDGISADGEILLQLGFGEGGKFSEIVRGDLTAKRSGELKRSIIAGLHTIQGLQLDEHSSELKLVDPAFGSATSHAAIIAASIAAKDVKLIPLSAKWAISDELSQWALPQSVDWLDRHVVLRINSEDGVIHDLLLDLVALDCIVRAGGGYVAEEFYAHDVRRIITFLGRLAETRKASGDQITLFMGGTLRSVSIDDGLIQVSGGS